MNKRQNNKKHTKNILNPAIFLTVFAVCVVFFIFIKTIYDDRYNDNDKSVCINCTGDENGNSDFDLDGNSCNNKNFCTDNSECLLCNENKMQGESPELPICSDCSFGKTHEIIKHDNYTLCYCEKFEQAEWVAYELTREDLEKNASRKNNFRSDPLVSTGSASPEDYYKSGYDRGHLAPAADMSFSQQAMDDSFFMSNMSPQHSDLNRKIWAVIEKEGREWAEKYGSVYIVTGPVLNKENFAAIGENKVAVPEFFYKIFVSWSNEDNKYVYISYLVPNSFNSQNPKDYTTSVTELENLTGIDFYPLLNDVVF
ncbi:MAG: DNA/RNA non-specific endonuclease [Treponemataceae bacterium]